MTAAQFRAARALLAWSAQDLADASGVGVTTIRKNELLPGKVTMIRSTVEAIRRAFDSAGIEAAKAGVVLGLRKLPEASPGWFPLFLFAMVAIGGLEYVKWQPYALRGFSAAAQHSIGPSIVSGVSATAPPAGWQAGFDYVAAYGHAVWKALLLALLLGAGVQVLLSPDLIRRVFAGRGARVRAVGAAMPSMMCSCCATPITVGLIRSHADTAAALVYWLANPVLNPATLVFIGLVFGWDWAALRLVLGTLLVFGLSGIAARILPPGSQVPAPEARRAVRAGPVGAYVAALLRLTVRLVPEYALLVFVLGAARGWLFPAMTPALGHAAWLPPLLAAIGTLFVIPTAGEVPVVQLLQQSGLGSAGSAALLLTLPTVSLPSLVMLGRVVAVRVLVMLGIGTFGIGLMAAGTAVALGL